MPPKPRPTPPARPVDVTPLEAPGAVEEPAAPEDTTVAPGEVLAPSLDAPEVSANDDTGDESTNDDTEPDPEAILAAAIAQSEQDALSAAPLDAPVIKHDVIEPPVPEALGSNTPALPEPFSRFVGEDGEIITAAAFRDVNPGFTYVETAERIYEEYLPDGFRTVMKRLVYPRGAHVLRNDAAAFVDRHLSA